MSAVVSALRRVAADLELIGGRVALVGGLAVSARAEPRFTRDLDFAVAVEDDLEAERIVYALQERGYRVRMILEQETTGRLATVRLVPPRAEDDEALADLLFASSGIEEEIVAQAEPMEVLPGLSVRVATAGHLIAMKTLAHDDVSRPKDAQDLLALFAVARVEDLDVARAALALITQRGYDRGKDLASEFARFLSRARR